MGRLLTVPWSVVPVGDADVSRLAAAVRRERSGSEALAAAALQSHGCIAAVLRAAALRNDVRAATHCTAHAALAAPSVHAVGPLRRWWRSLRRDAGASVHAAHHVTAIAPPPAWQSLRGSES